MNHKSFLQRLIGITVKTVFALMLTATSLLAQAIDWPQEIDTAEGTIVIYQLQPEKLEGNVISGRAAMSLEPNNKTPIFGAFWFSARVDTDTDAGTALVRDLKVTRVSWPDSTEENEARFTTVVENALPKNGYPISLERLSASLKEAEQEKKSLDGLKNDPPAIIFSQELAVLLSYDGQPRFADIENSNYKRALNTRFAVVQDTKNNTFYLTSGTLWYTAKSPTGPWAVTQSPPDDLVKMAPKPDPEQTAPAKPPQIIAATVPTELIVSDGKPKWKSLPGGKLLYVENTETPWLRETDTGKMYLLLAGRWFNSSSENGPWVFVRPDKLPVSFKDIPPDSDLGGLRVSVAGTEEAEDALLDAQIPVTTAVKRSEAKLTVTYDGAPKFEKIAGTKVSYAVNTAAQVLLIENRYYAVDSGIWFTSAAATGPWVVADKVPKEEIAKIPPSSPVYNVTYVEVYESTPEVVYVGYTAGYTGSYPYYGAPYYGTGYYYPPYWGGGYYYPYPPTWGLHVGYNPYTGWNVGLSWSNGFFSVGIGWSQGWNGNYPCCRNGCWDGGDFNRNVINTGDINIGNSINGNRDRVSHNQNNRAGNRNGVSNTANNIYQRPQNRARNADRATTNRNLQQARSVQRENNVFADKSGNVARRVGDDWQVRDQGNWTSSISERDFDTTRNNLPERNNIPTTNERIPSTTKNKLPETPKQLPTERRTQPTQTERTQTTRTQTNQNQINRQELNRSYESRQHGTSRQMSRPMGGGGGGRRR